MKIKDVEEIISKMGYIVYTAARPYAASGDADDITEEVNAELRKELMKYVSE